MTEELSPLQVFRRALASSDIDPLTIARNCLRQANGNASRNTYIGFDPERLLARAGELRDTGAPLFGVPVSVKDCFDVAGEIMSCGSRFYAGEHSPARADSAVVRRLRELGCLITGKTHLHALAYGITGENADYGDCLQPRDSSLLTGGSSSGAAASVQEGSALAAIGTDTGGSIRVPAALSGLVGWRCSLAASAPFWEGGAHLAPSFDTAGMLFGNVRDARELVDGVFGIAAAPPRAPRMGCVAESFLSGCVPEVLASYRVWKRRLAHAGAVLVEFEATDWEAAGEIFAGIQAHEAAALHSGHYDRFDPAIAARLRWGASLDKAAVAALRARLADFRKQMAGLFARFDLLMLPCAPVNRLLAGADHAAVRASILRYTTPFSLAGLPVLALPGPEFGTGVQVAAGPARDAALLGFADWLAGVVDG